MNYARIEETIVVEIIPEVDPVFPTMSIYERYHPDIIAQLVVIPENVNVEQNWQYINGEFVAPEEPVEPEPVDPYSEVWDELDAAYQEGVNTAYDS